MIYFKQHTAKDICFIIYFKQHTAKLAQHTANFKLESLFCAFWNRTLANLNTGVLVQVVVHFMAWLTRHCSHCCTEMCIILGFFAFLGFIFSCITLLTFTSYPVMLVGHRPCPESVDNCISINADSWMLCNIHFLRRQSLSVQMVFQ